QPGPRRGRAARSRWIVTSTRVRATIHRDGPGPRAGTRGRYFLPTLRPKTNFSVGTLGSVVVPSWAVPASLVTAGIAKYWNVIVVSPGCWPGSTSKIEDPERWGRVSGL